MRPAACHTPPTPCVLHSQLQLTTSLPNTSPCVIYDSSLIFICVKIVCTDDHLRVVEGICTELALFVKMRAKRTLRAQQATASYQGDSKCRKTTNSEKRQPEASCQNEIVLMPSECHSQAAKNQSCVDR